MIQKLKNIFKQKKIKGPEDYNGFADFLLNASDEEKKKVFIEAAQGANEEQMRIYKAAQMKIGTQ